MDCLYGGVRQLGRREWDRDGMLLADVEIDIDIDTDADSVATRYG